MPISPQRYRARMCFFDCFTSVSKVYLHHWHPNFAYLDTRIHFSAKKSQIYLHTIDFFILWCMLYRPKKITSAFYHTVRSIWPLQSVCRKKFWIWMLYVDFKADLINCQNCRISEKLTQNAICRYLSREAKIEISAHLNFGEKASTKAYNTYMSVFRLH